MNVTTTRNYMTTNLTSYISLFLLETWKKFCKEFKKRRKDGLQVFVQAFVAVGKHEDITNCSLDIQCSRRNYIVSCGYAGVKKFL